jgi:hypothetical protein
MTRRERQQPTRRDPLDARQRRVQIARERVERHVHDGRVEDGRDEPVRGYSRNHERRAIKPAVDRQTWSRSRLWRAYQFPRVQYRPPARPRRRAGEVDDCLGLVGGRTTAA